MCAVSSDLGPIDPPGSGRGMGAIRRPGTTRPGRRRRGARERPRAGRGHTPPAAGSARGPRGRGAATAHPPPRGRAGAPAPTVGELRHHERVGGRVSGGGGHRQRCRGTPAPPRHACRNPSRAPAKPAPVRVRRSGGRAPLHPDGCREPGPPRGQRAGRRRRLPPPARADGRHPRQPPLRGNCGPGPASLRRDGASPAGAGARDR